MFLFRPLHPYLTPIRTYPFSSKYFNSTVLRDPVPLLTMTWNVLVFGIFNIFETGSLPMRPAKHKNYVGKLNGLFIPISVCKGDLRMICKYGLALLILVYYTVCKAHTLSNRRTITHIKHTF
jgi:hypothetical protein